MDAVEEIIPYSPGELDQQLVEYACNGWDALKHSLLLVAKWQSPHILDEPSKLCKENRKIA